MSVLCQGVRGGRSSPQVNAVSITAASGAKAALSRSSNDRSAVGVADACSRTARRPSFSVAADRLGVGVEHHLVRVEAVALAPARTGRGRGSRRAGRAARRAGSRARPGRSARAAAMRCDSVCGVGGVEQAQLDLGGVLGEQGEVDAGAVPRRPERVRRARPDTEAALGHKSR